MGMKSTGGEIVQVQGGHIVRSTGRKDRHSKVCTAKGPRDRRVRLSAHTAIQFYDVQDRLGYDRPSKAVDWLINKAKSAIDKLAELPPWHPLAANNTNETEEAEETEQNAGSSDMANIGEQQSESSGYNFQIHSENGSHSAFTIPQPIDSSGIANFFPTTSANAASINFQSYPHDIINRTNNTTEDLGLSLHSFQAGANNQTPENEHQTIFAGSTPIGFDGNYQRIVNWNNDASSHMNRDGFMMNSNAFLGQCSGSSAYSQRGTLQSSFPPSVRTWNEIPMSTSSEHHHKSQQVLHQASPSSSIFGSRFLSEHALQGFFIPSRIQGEEENHGVASNNKPSSASPNSHH